MVYYFQYSKRFVGRWQHPINLWPFSKSNKDGSNRHHCRDSFHFNISPLRCYKNEIHNFTIFPAFARTIEFILSTSRGKSSIFTNVTLCNSACRPSTFCLSKAEFPFPLSDNRLKACNYLFEGSFYFLHFEYRFSFVIIEIAFAFF